MLVPRALCFIAAVSLLVGAAPVRADDALSRDLPHTVEPFINTYCVSCHNPDKSKGDLDLTTYTSVDAIAKDLRRWELLRDRLQAGEMPPEKAQHQPTPAERAKVIAWIASLHQYEAHRHAGDPGPVVARRLSNAEYDNTIRDLTGVDLHPAREFPVDPANEAGFDNSGESLTMTAGLLKKYLQAARDVSDHLVLAPDGLEFAPHPVVADTDRDKFCVNRIIAFYRSQPTDYADYFYAAWRYENHAALGHPNATLDDAAQEVGVSPKYLPRIWTVLTDRPQRVGPIAALQVMWQALPQDATAARAGCTTLRDFVLRIRPRLAPHVDYPSSPGVNEGSQTLVLWYDRTHAANRRLCRTDDPALRAAVGSLPPTTSKAARRALELPVGRTSLREYESSCQEFCFAFPDALLVSERARAYVSPTRELQNNNVGRYLSAGLHNQMGYFRDDGPLCDLVLDDAQRRRLDELWLELDVVANVPWRQYSGFAWFERAEDSFMNAPEFAFARAEDKDIASPEKMTRLEEVYTAKAKRLGASQAAMQAMHDYFREMSTRVRRVEQTRVAAESTQLRDLTKFAERAYRRPLTDDERRGVVAFYRSLREKDGLDHEEAVRDTLASILMSPSFCYRLDLPRQGGVAGGAVRPLDDIALANRLSYFLWASMPDQELLDLATAGRLHDPSVLVAQAHRLLADPRARGFATEFAGNWLDFRRFEQHNGVAREKFPAFTNDLRQAMFEEPIRFVLDVARQNRSVLDLLYADDTLVNPTLAKHYGMPVPDGVAPDQWFRVTHATPFGRGGLLPMAVFLTNNSPGLRTSPVKRGNWVVKRILGEHIPPPPAKVPELPADESKLGDLTLREALAHHRADPSCAACHERFDSMGLVFEGYGPVGERRAVDLGGKPVDSAATFPGGSEGAGLAGLRTYIRDHRQNDFLENLCRELLAYGLGRSLLPSDDDTIAAMRARLASDHYRFDNLIDVIVTSPQFLNKRVNAEVSQKME